MASSSDPALPLVTVSTGLPWSVPHPQMLQWLADVGRYHWIRRHAVPSDPDPIHGPRWIIPVALLLRFRGPDFTTVLDAARRTEAQAMGRPLSLGEDPH